MEELIARLHDLEKLVTNTKNEIHQNFCNSTEDIETLFFKWAKSGCQTFTQSWILHIQSASGIDIVEKYNDSRWIQRHQTIDIEMFTEWFYDLLGKGHPIGNGLFEEDDEDSLEENNLTREDVHDWMKELMKMNFLSFKYDW